MKKIENTNYILMIAVFLLLSSSIVSNISVGTENASEIEIAPILDATENISENNIAPTAVTTTINDFGGHWTNIDLETGGITTIDINVITTNLAIHSYGKCYPTDCDWGSETVLFEGNPVTVVYQFSFKITTNVISLLPDGRLEVNSDNVFIDGTNRDYIDTYYFKKYSASDFAGHWTNINENTRGITNVDILESGNYLDTHIWGACVPTDCDWGVVSTMFNGNPVNIFYNHTYAERTIEMALLADGTLRVVVDSVFLDGSDRDYVATYYFRLNPDLSTGMADFIGYWINTNPVSLPAIDIKANRTSLDVQTFGDCYPSFCDWGVETVPFEGNPVIVTYIFSFKVATNTMTLLPNGTLKVWSVNVFTDGTNRDWNGTFFYEKSNIMDYVGYWDDIIPDINFPAIEIKINGSNLDVKTNPATSTFPLVTVPFIGGPVVVVYTFSFKIVTHTMTLLSNGTLELESVNLFTDGTNRDWNSTSYYAKQSSPPLITDFVGHWTNKVALNGEISIIDIQRSGGNLDIHSWVHLMNLGVDSTYYKGNPVIYEYNSKDRLIANSMQLFSNGTILVDTDFKYPLDPGKDYSVSGLFTKSIQAQITKTDFIGFWSNIDSDTRGVTSIDIQAHPDGLGVHTYGSCSPIDCDWGVEPSPFMGNPLKVVYTFSFKISTHTMTLLPDGTLRLVSVNVFIDGSNRDYTATWYFRKTNMMDFVGYWTNVDSNTDGITTIDIQDQANRLAVQTWGKCHPADCDWGVERIHFWGNPVTVVYTPYFKIATNTMTLLPDGRLKVVSDNVFIDGTNRDYVATWFFTKPTPIVISQSDFDGYWINVDNETRGITAVNIKSNGTNLDVQSWGACYPFDCDWGVESALYESNPVTVVYNPFFKIASNTMTLLVDGRLKVYSENIFTDGTNRDYNATWFFTKSNIVDYVGYWANEDEDTGGITALDIQARGNDLLVQSWGACVPEDCNWNIESALYQGDPVTVIYSFSFKIATNEMTLLNDGRIKLISDNVFVDGTNRDYKAIWYFVHSTKPDVTTTTTTSSETSSTTSSSTSTTDNTLPTVTITVTTTESAPVPFATYSIAILALLGAITIRYSRRKS